MVISKNKWLSVRIHGYQQEYKNKFTHHDLVLIVSPHDVSDDSLQDNRIYLHLLATPFTALVFVSHQFGALINL